MQALISLPLILFFKILAASLALSHSLIKLPCLSYCNTGIDVTASGSRSAESNTGSYVLALGTCAGMCNAISVATIVNNSVLPSYINFATASASITIGTGGVTGNTYLFYNQANCSIEAIRL